MNYNKNLEGKKIILKNIELSNCTDEYLNWLNNIEINKFLESRLSVQTLETLTQFVLNIKQSDNNYMFAIINKETKKHIGNVKIGPIHLIYKNAFIGFLIGEKQNWGKNFATESVFLALNFCFNILNLHKINAGVIATNTGSIKLMEKLGFKKEACIRDDIILDGKYLDVYRYGLLKNELIIP